MALCEIKFDDEIYKIAYEIVGDRNLEKILILHGWGANKELMKNSFAKFLNNFCQIYIDLAGMGKSSIQKPLTTQDYAKIVKIFSEKFGEISNVMGHSFGGKVGILLEPKNLILLSSAGILEKKPLKVRLKIKTTKMFNFFGFSKFSKLFRSKDVLNMNEIMYKTFKNVVNENFEDEFLKRNLNNNFKTLIFWGKEDKATNIKSGEKIHNLIKNSYFLPLEGDHFFFIKNSKFISDEINKILKHNAI